MAWQLIMQVRIYTENTVREQLQEAQRDYIRASVGLSSTGRLLVPKMLHCFAKGMIDSDANLGVWISQYLPPHQAAFVEHCMSKRRHSHSLLISSRNCGILPFDTRFRYLFLPEQMIWLLWEMLGPPVHRVLKLYLIEDIPPAASRL